MLAEVARVIESLRRPVGTLTLADFTERYELCNATAKTIERTGLTLATDTGSRHVPSEYSQPLFSAVTGLYTAVGGCKDIPGIEIARARFVAAFAAVGGSPRATGGY